MRTLWPSWLVQRYTALRAPVTVLSLPLWYHIVVRTPDVRGSPFFPFTCGRVSLPYCLTPAWVPHCGTDPCRSWFPLFPFYLRPCVPPLLPVILPLHGSWIRRGSFFPFPPAAVRPLPITRGFLPLVVHGTVPLPSAVPQGSYHRVRFRQSCLSFLVLGPHPRAFSAHVAPLFLPVAHFSTSPKLETSAAQVVFDFLFLIFYAYFGSLAPVFVPFCYSLSRILVRIRFSKDSGLFSELLPRCGYIDLILL